MYFCSLTYSVLPWGHKGQLFTFRMISMKVHGRGPGIPIVFQPDIMIYVPLPDILILLKIDFSLFTYFL